MTEELAKLYEYESRVRESTLRYLEEGGIDYIDALPALRAQLEQGPPPYPSDLDGHPNAAGYDAIARQVWAGLQEHAGL